MINNMHSWEGGVGGGIFVGEGSGSPGSRYG